MENFFTKKKIDVMDVAYITREGRKSVLNLTDGTKLETFETIKRIIADDTTNNLECINKGVVVNMKHVSLFEDNKFTMKDGTIFLGRVRATKKELAVVENIINGNKNDKWVKYSILERMPLAFCVIELVFDKDGRGLDFIFRYCNEEMAALEGKPIEEMIDNSFYEVFKNGDKKWLVIYADVALNGTSRVIESYSPEIDSQLRIYCYQPEPNYCACALVKL